MMAARILVLKAPVNVCALLPPLLSRCADSTLRQLLFFFLFDPKFWEYTGRYYRPLWMGVALGFDDQFSVRRWKTKLVRDIKVLQ